MTDTEKRAKDLGRIKALFAKATDPASSESESRAAMELANKLMGRSSITQADVDNAGDDEFGTIDKPLNTSAKSGKTLLHPVIRYLATNIGNYAGCKIFLLQDHDATKVRYFGFTADVEFAKIIIDRLTEHFDEGWNTYKAVNTILRRDLYDERVSYSIAFARAFINRIDGWSTNNQTKKHEILAEATEQALVAQRSDLITDKLRERGIILDCTDSRVGGKQFKANARASGAGHMQGNSASVGAGVSNRQRQKLLG